MNWEYFKEVWQQHCGKITGAFFGVLMAIMIILFGFFIKNKLITFKINSNTIIFAVVNITK